MIENARDAHKAGKVWVEVTVNGGKVLGPSGKQPIGRISLKGPFSPQAALELWKAVMAVERSGP